MRTYLGCGIIHLLVHSAAELRLRRAREAQALVCAQHGRDLCWVREVGEDVAEHGRILNLEPESQRRSSDR